MTEGKPDVVVLAAAKVGGILANRSCPTDFLLENLRIETQVIEAAWRLVQEDYFFLEQLQLPKIRCAAGTRRSASDRCAGTNQCLVCNSEDLRDQALRSLRLQHGLDAVSLMPTNLYGPGDNYDPIGGHVLPALIRRFHEAKKGCRLSDLLGYGNTLKGVSPCR